MIISLAKHWNDRDYYYIQTNNPTEEILRKAGKVRDFLESCGSTAAVNCLAAHGYDLEVYCPGEYKPQPEEVLQDWFNDPRNYKTMHKVRRGVEQLPGNRVPQFYPPAVKDVFNVECRFRWFITHHDLIEWLQQGYTIQVCLQSPSHYIAVVAFDTRTSEFIYNDPWPGRFEDNDGFNKRFSDMENLNAFAVIYPRPARGVC